MSRPHRKAYLNYSKSLSIPLFGPLFYALQNSLYKRGAINTVYASRKETKLQKALFMLISKNSSAIICKSFKFGRQLKILKSKIVLDVAPYDLKKLSSAELHNLMWSLTFAKRVTRQTKKALKNFIPEDFPVSDKIVIPYNDSFDVLCDYVFQTAKVLGEAGHFVYLIASGYPKWIITNPFKRVFGRKGEGQKLNYRNLEIIYPLKLFPFALQRFPLVKRLNRYFSILTSSIFVKRLKPDLLWSFDHQDLELVRLIKDDTTSLYDCVDYFSTLDPLINKQIRKRERKLIKSVNYFIVNSQALRSVKKAIREPDAVVPQGFDVESFETKEVLSPKERREISSTKKLFKTIPHPRVGYVGNLTYRLDFKLLRSLIRKMPKTSFVFTDAFLPIPTDDKYRHTKRLIKKIKSLKNVYLVPRTQSRKVIKEIVRNFDIGIIPYNVSFDFNRYCYPMKLFEYFYMGKSVVSTPIEELKLFPKFVKIGNNSKSWEKHIKNLLSKSLSVKYKEEQRFLSEKNSWENKIEAINKVLLIIIYSTVLINQFVFLSFLDHLLY